MQPIFEACLKDSNYFSDYQIIGSFLIIYRHSPHVDTEKNRTAKHDVLLRGAMMMVLCFKKLLCVSLLNLCQQFSTFVLARAVDGVADDALLIDHDGEGEALGANPRHHVLGLDEVRPCEVVFVGYPLG